MTAPLGTFCLVLHTHLPWLAHHGRWPVGEEWLHQAWAQSYGPLLGMLARLGDRGHRDLLTIGVTPVLAAQLDDPYCLHEHHRWLADWMLRADDLSGQRDATLRRLGVHESRQARQALERFEASWSGGGSPVWRSLADAGVVELLGGPATHPVLPLVREPVADLALATGLDDHQRRLGRRPTGIWLPECAYQPGQEMPEDCAFRDVMDPDPVYFVYHSIERISRSRTAAYDFLSDNRRQLLIPCHQDLRVVDLYDAIKYGAQAKRLPREIVLEYAWQEVLPLTPTAELDFGQWNGKFFTMDCGGTLVFDDRGYLLSLFRKPGTEHLSPEEAQKLRRKSKPTKREKKALEAVSYTHLTLPTN